ncbi:MAG: hypothetical protein QXO96_02210 [Sulfolobales archaeon]
MSKLKEYKTISIDLIKEVEEFKNFIPENDSRYKEYFSDLGISEKEIKLFG